MISFYIHIPFCLTKCKYCSFQVLPKDKFKVGLFDKEVENYVNSIISHIQKYSEILKDKEIKSIYFGGGTPQIIGFENTKKIVDEINKHFDTENIGELSIELNPYPQKETLNMIKDLTKYYKKFSRVRFSFGIQSFDNKTLSESGRDISFPGIVEFLRGLRPLKKQHNIFNLDFIAFGLFSQTKKGDFQLRNKNSLDFFQELTKSKFIDSFSIYTLELFPGSERYYNNNGKLKIDNEKLPITNCQSATINGNDDDIYEEFAILKDIVLDAGYSRYELSNFSLAGKSSIHNRVYREMGDYIGLGTSASSFIKNPNPDILKYLGIKNSQNAIRRNNTLKISEYILGNFVDQETIFPLDTKDLLIEEFFLSLRTDFGIKDISKYSSILVDDVEKKIESYSKQGFIQKDGTSIKLTDAGMDIYNDIVTEIMKEI